MHLNETIKRVLEIVADTVKPNFPKYEYISDWAYRLALTGMTDYDLAQIPKDIPEELREQYLELLDFYSAEELETYRFEYGDWIISDLYETDIGLFGWETQEKCYDMKENGHEK